ncbi:MAG: DUF2851 family protein [Chitinophagales bacterium]
MTEKFLHYLWRMKLLKNNILQTESGEKIQIIAAGELNTNAGPDFLNGRIKIGETLWAGNIEIHLKSSDWSAHGHQHDRAYDNIVLHVVYENDRPVCREDGSSIPCLVVKNYFDSSIYEKYQLLMQSSTWIPCEQHIHKSPAIIVQQWLNRLLIERMEEKIQPILSALQENQNNWEETFYQFLAMSYGARVNAEPFQRLARAIPVKVLAKHKNNLFQLEALLFGTAGFLDEKFTDDYPNELKKEFSFLRKKYGLQSLKKHTWKFLRLRPANFPSIRLAQFAQLIFKASHLFSKILEAGNVNHFTLLFESTASSYWNNHYRFDHSSADRKKSLGSASAELLLINTIAPFLFVYGKSRDENIYCERAFTILEQLSAENNTILKNWKELGIKAHTAFESQALLQLHNSYCKNFRCLDCAIGHQLLIQKGLAGVPEQQV